MTDCQSKTSRKRKSNVRDG